MKTFPGFCLFDTPLGRCAIAWGRQGVLALRLPEAFEDDTRNALRDSVPYATERVPTEDIAGKIERIRSVLAGGRDDLHTIQLDMTGVPEFHRRVYEETRAILPGETRTYGEIARALGDAGAARAVGVALGANRFPLIVPCHRVVGASGKMTGFSAPGGIETKLRLLRIEGAAVAPPPTLFDNDRAFVLASRPKRA